MSTAQFDQRGHLWIELTDGKIPPSLVNKAEMFMVEDDVPSQIALIPGRVMLDLTDYIETLIFRNMP